ncbi:hypothetical protein ES689_08135 [Frigoribacterium sp. ACAM 257]|uniref:hypothetical protein n=1 Tax=Frigoribacterium sp. ACAM 257 TaxID=2508998 RepID=UPI0011BA0594|nr:hypothetical protein [Frigoribacterium sp. ACAM 257]TWX38584.1 hypothetical protein ES689_08135 [Frigoribacterium sp. ACAM 257]
MDVTLRDQVVARRTTMSPFVGGRRSPSSVVVDAADAVVLVSGDGHRTRLCTLPDIVVGGWSPGHGIPGGWLDVGDKGFVWMQTATRTVTFALDDWWPLRPGDPLQGALESTGFAVLFQLAGVTPSTEAPPPAVHEDILAAVVPSKSLVLMRRSPLMRAQAVAMLIVALSYVVLLVSLPVAALIVRTPFSFTPWMLPLCAIALFCSVAAAAPLPSWRRAPAQANPSVSLAPTGPCPAWFRRRARIEALDDELVAVDGTGVWSRVRCGTDNSSPLGLKDFDVRPSTQTRRGSLVIWDVSGAPRLVLPLELWAPTETALAALRATLRRAGLTEVAHRRRDVDLPAPFDVARSRLDGLDAVVGLGPWRVPPLYVSARLAILASSMLLPFLFAGDLVDDSPTRVVAAFSACVLVAADVAVLTVVVWALLGHPVRGGLVGVVRRWKEKRS